MVYKFEFVPDDFIRTDNISKGEKTINVKRTAKRKAHKRVIITHDLDRLGDKKLSYKSSHDFIKNEIGFKIDMRENDKYTKDPLMGEQIIVIDSKGNKLDVWIKETSDMIQLSTIGAQEKGTGIGTKYLLGLKKYVDISGKKLVIPNMTPSGKKYFSQFDWLKDDTVKFEWEEKGKHEEYYPENTMSYMTNKDKEIVSTDYKKAEKIISVKGTSKRKAHKRKITFEGKVKEPEITKLSGKELTEWQEWQQYYKDKLFRPSISPHDDYYSQAILVGKSPEHTKTLISIYQARDPSSMGVDLVADFEELYQRTKGDVPKKHKMDPINLVEIKPIDESGIPGLVGGIHKKETFICKFEDESKAIHKVMINRKIAGEVGAYEISKILNWDIIPETVQYDYNIGRGEGSTQKFIKDTKEFTDSYNENGIEASEKHFDNLSKIFIMDMINGNNDRHSGNIIIDPDGKCWGIDNEMFGARQVKNFIETLDQWAKTGDGNYVPMMTILRNSIGNDQRMFQKFKDCVDENLIRVMNHGNKIIDYWNKNDNINDETKKNLEYNVNYLTKYYIDRWEINKSIKIILPFKR